MHYFILTTSTQYHDFLSLFRVIVIVILYTMITDHASCDQRSFEIFQKYDHAIMII
jgi:hypothetical protein